MKNKKLIALVCCLALVVGAVGATLAWLTDKTEEVKNTFTTSNIDITLVESETTPEENGDVSKEFQMVPGYTLDKDPVAKVVGGSEACYLFVTVEEKGGVITTADDVTHSFDSFIDYSVITGEGEWTKLKSVSTDAKGVYYRIVAESTSDQLFEIIQTMVGNEAVENKVTVKPTVTKEMMDALMANPNQNPQLIFKAYATQLYKANPEEDANKFTPEEAWNAVKDFN